MTSYWQLFFLFLLVICTFEVARPLHILSLIGTPIQKHAEWYGALHDELTARNHTFTIISTYALSGAKLHRPHIKLKSLKEGLPYAPSEGFGPFVSSSNLDKWYQAQEDNCNYMIDGRGYNDAIAELQLRNQDIDLILYDITFNPWCVLMMTDYYPYVSIFALSAFKALPEHFEIARGGLVAPGVTPFFISSYTEKMGVFERFWNAYLYYKGNAKFWGTVDNVEATIRKDPYLRKYGMPRIIRNVMKRIKLIFVNSHPAIDYSMPLPSNIIEIGGMNLGKPSPLPPPTEAMIKRAKNGVIYMDLGEHMTIQKLGRQKVSDITNVMARLHEYSFVWSVTDAQFLPLNEMPGNLEVGYFEMQREFLAHPNVKLLITEANHLNIQEAIYFGVPLVVIPLNLDQPNNAVRVEERKFGHYILFDDIDVPNFRKAILDTLNSKECTKSVQMAKHAFHSNPRKPLDTVIAWIENKGIKKLQYLDYIISKSAEHSNYIKRHSLDAILATTGLIIVGAILTAVVLYYSIKCCCRTKCCASCKEWMNGDDVVTIKAALLRWLSDIKEAMFACLGNACRTTLAWLPRNRMQRRNRNADNIELARMTAAATNPIPAVENTAHRKQPQTTSFMGKVYSPLSALQASAEEEAPKNIVAAASSHQPKTEQVSSGAELHVVVIEPEVPGARSRSREQMKLDLHNVTSQPQPAPDSIDAILPCATSPTLPDEPSTSEAARAALKRRQLAAAPDCSVPIVHNPPLAPLEVPESVHIDSSPSQQSVSIDYPAPLKVQKSVSIDSSTSQASSDETSPKLTFEDISSQATFDVNERNPYIKLAADESATSPTSSDQMLSDESDASNKTVTEQITIGAKISENSVSSVLSDEACSGQISGVQSDDTSPEYITKTSIMCFPESTESTESTSSD